MKAEQFDHYVRAQFENDVVAPPERLEGAVFAALEGQSQGRKGWLGAAALVLTVASSAALWMGTHSVDEGISSVSNAEIETTILEDQAAPESAPDPATALTVLPIVSEEPEQVEVDANRTAAAVAQPLATAESAAPGSLETMDARIIDGVAVDPETSAPELQQKSKETWVLPAVVKVND